jgi:hypothetical protein
MSSQIWLSRSWNFEVPYREINENFGGHIFSLILVQLAGTVASRALTVKLSLGLLRPG